MELWGVLLIIVGIAAIVAFFVWAFIKQYRNVGPNEVLIISGGKQHTVTDADGNQVKVGYRTQIGGGTFINPFTETAEVLPLETFTVYIKTPEVLTRQGVHIIVDAAAQVKIASSDEAIRKAAEQFLGRGSAAIKEVTEHILEGYMRSALGARTVEEIYQNRDDFAKVVVEAATGDLAKMGLNLLSFNLKDISDSQGYIDALGMPQIAQVKRDAAIAQAETEKDTKIKSAEARKEGDIVRYQVETEIANAAKDYELKRSEFQIEMNRQKAQTDSAYDLEKHKLAAEVKRAESETRLIEKEEAIKLEKKEIERRELDLEASVKKPAEARKYQLELEAETEKNRLAKIAEGKAEAAKTEGLAEIEVKKAAGISRIEYTKKFGEAEALAMTAKAEAYKEYNQAAMYEMLIEKLPELAKAVSEPMSRIDKMIVVDSGENGGGASRVTKQVADVLAQLPTVVNSLSGIDLEKILGKKEKPEETE